MYRRAVVDVSGMGDEEESRSGKCAAKFTSPDTRQCRVNTIPKNSLLHESSNFTSLVSRLPVSSMRSFKHDLIDVLFLLIEVRWCVDSLPHLMSMAMRVL